jgi:hypothetical protein
LSHFSLVSIPMQSRSSFSSSTPMEYTSLYFGRSSFLNSCEILSDTAEHLRMTQENFGSMWCPQLFAMPFSLRQRSLSHKVSVEVNRRRRRVRRSKTILRLRLWKRY